VSREKEETTDPKNLKNSQKHNSGNELSKRWQMGSHMQLLVPVTHMWDCNIHEVN